MQLADWLFTLLMLRSDDPHGRSALEVTLAPPQPARTIEPVPPPDRHR
jgi:hypothetical protein